MRINFVLNQNVSTLDPCHCDLANASNLIAVASGFRHKERRNLLDGIHVKLVSEPKLILELLRGEFENSVAGHRVAPVIPAP